VLLGPLVLDLFLSSFFPFRDELASYDPWSDDGAFCRSRTWMLLAYTTCVGAIAGAVVVMIHVGGAWLGLAATLQVALVLGGALVLFVSRPPGEDGGGYSAF
jgi:hypothetical protein